MIGLIVDRLSAPVESERHALAALPKTAEDHDQALADLACMNAIEAAGVGRDTAPLSFPLTVAAWNLERCLFPEESASALRETGAALVLLSEMDQGMARTHQRHPTAEVATALGMAYAYGVEFLELGLGSEIELSFCEDDFNAMGFHGNALMASNGLRSPFMLRLPGDCLWFRDGEQPRIGTRCAIGALVDTVDGPMVAISVHLESVANSAYRERQVAAIIDAVEALAPGLPIMIGGDLNTGNHTGGDFDNEALFSMAADRGFSRHGGPIEQMSTRPSLITRFPERAMKLDWFLARGLEISKSALVSSLTTEGKPLSDHDMILCRIEGFSSTM